MVTTRVKLRSTFGEFLREICSRKADASFSVRKLAARVGIEPSYLSKIERGEQSPPGEETIRKIAAELGENSDVLLALAGDRDAQLLGDSRDAAWKWQIRH